MLVPHLRRRDQWLVILAALALLAAFTWIIREYFTSKVPGANDFFSRWAGAHLYLMRGWNPYGEETSLWIQNAIYGHPATPEQDASLFAYPFYTIFLVAPYALLPYDWAQAAWQTTLLVVVIITLFLLLGYYRWRPKPVMLGLLTLWMVFFYPTARSVILGQLGLVVFLFTVWAAWLMFRQPQACPRCDALAGVLLAITTIKPQMQFLIIPFFLLWALKERRWRVIIGFGIAFVLFLIVSFALLPTWLFEWIAQVQQYPGYTPPAVLYILTHEVLRLGAAAPLVERVLDVILVLYLLYEWWRVLWPRGSRPSEWRVDWVIGLTLIITHLIVPRTATTHFVVFLFLLIPFFRDLTRRGTNGTTVLIAVMLGLAVGMWWLFVATLDGNQEHNLVHVPLPLLMMLVALWMRPRERALLPSMEPAP